MTWLTSTLAHAHAVTQAQGTQLRRTDGRMCVTDRLRAAQVHEHVATGGCAICGPALDKAVNPNARSRSSRGRERARVATKP